MCAKTKKSKRNSMDWIFRNLPFIFFVGALGVAYIAAGHYAEKKTRNIKKLQNELKVLKWEYISIEAQTMSGSTPSKMIEKNKDKNLGQEGGSVVEIK